MLTKAQPDTTGQCFALTRYNSVLQTHLTRTFFACFNSILDIPHAITVMLRAWWAAFLIGPNKIGYIIENRAESYS